jgi:hypothetical protein
MLQAVDVLIRLKSLKFRSTGQSWFFGEMRKSGLQGHVAEALLASVNTPFGASSG